MIQRNNLSEAECLKIADKIKRETRVISHIVRDELSGKAFPRLRIIEAPKGRDPDELYIIAHECGHVLLDHAVPRELEHVTEAEAETWAHATLMRHGVPITQISHESAINYIRLKYNTAREKAVSDLYIGNRTGQINLPEPTTFRDEVIYILGRMVSQWKGWVHSWRH